MDNHFEFEVINRVPKDVPITIENGTVTVDLTAYDPLSPFEFPAFSNIPGLQDLRMFSNYLKLIPDADEFCTMEQLKFLFMSCSPIKRGNGLSRLPSQFSRFLNLEELHLDGNHFEAFPMPICQLSNVRKLFMDNCYLKRIPQEIKNMSSLEVVDFSFNSLGEIHSLPKEMFDLANLTDLFLIDCELNDLPPEIGNLKTLKGLRIGKNNLSKLPDELFDLKNLTKLNVERNYISELSPKIGELHSLTLLLLMENMLTTLPDTIKDLKNCRHINVFDNKLTCLPRSITDMPALESLIIEGNNNLRIPPLEVCARGPNSIKGYFESIAAVDTQAVHSERLKVVLLGEAGAGKTSLAYALVQSKALAYPDDEPQSRVGIDFYTWLPVFEGVMFHIVEHSVKGFHLSHPFLLFSEALHILVVDLFNYKPNGECFSKTVGDWLDLLTSRILQPRIMIVPTHLDRFQPGDEDSIKRKCTDILERVEHYCKTHIALIDSEISEKKLKEKKKLKKTLQGGTDPEWKKKNLPIISSVLLFGDNEEACPTQDNVKSYIAMVPVSNKGELTGVKVLEEEILRVANDCQLFPSVGKNLPEDWIKLEKALRKVREENKVRCMSYEEFEAFAKGCTNLSSGGIHSALSYLDAIGELRYFSNISSHYKVFIDFRWLAKLTNCLFRHDLETKLQHNDNFLRYGVPVAYFNELKEKLLKEAVLSQDLLRCLWDEFSLDDDMILQMVELFSYLGLVVPLSHVDDDSLLVPWYLTDTYPVADEFLAWSLPEDQEEINLLFMISYIPPGLFDRLRVRCCFLDGEYLNWKDVVLLFVDEHRAVIRKHEFPLGAKSSSPAIYIKGRGPKSCLESLWEVLLRIVQEVDALLTEWPGLRVERCSLCPLCAQKRKSKPCLFPCNWIKSSYLSKKAMICRSSKFLRKNKFDVRLIYPPSDVVKKLRDSQLPPSSVPSEIVARGIRATKAYNRALLEGKTYVRRVPVMIIGQDRTGKTSLKKSLKGETFNPNEKSTVGIETDPSYFKVSTDVWRTGVKSKGNKLEQTFSFEHQAAQMIFDSLRNRSTDYSEAKELTEKPNTSGSESQIDLMNVAERCNEPSGSRTESSLQESKVFGKAKANSSVSELSEEANTSRIKPAFQDPKVLEKPKANSATINGSQKPSTSGIKPSLQDSKDHLVVSNLPEDVASLVQKLLENNKEAEDQNDIYSILWDFGGQSVYYATHPIFLTEKAIYILVSDLSRDPHQKGSVPMKKGMSRNIKDKSCSKTNLDNLDFWMSSVYSLVSPDAVSQKDLRSEKLPPVFLVCTHADTPYCSEDPEVLAREIYGSLKDKIYGKLLKGFFVVDNTKSGSADECQGVKKLREKVHFVAKNLPQMNEAIPLKWLKYEKVLRLVSEEGYKWIPIKKARHIALDECGINDDDQFQTLLNFLHDQRVLIHFNESQELRNMVILNPQWLIDMFKEVITVRSWELVEESVEDLWRNLEKNGILDEKLLDSTWRHLFVNQETCKSLVAIMERFSLLCPWPSDCTTKQYLVPSMLKSPPTADVLELLASVRIPSLFVRFESCRVPPGLFSRLILLFHHWAQDKWSRPIKPKLFNNFALFHIRPHDATSVILLCHSSSIEIVLHVMALDEVSDLKLGYVSDLDASRLSRDIHRQLRLLLECMRKEFSWLKHMKYETCVSCPVCSQRGGSKCRDHGVRGCDCLHLLSELELQDYPYCDRHVVCADCRIHKEMFVHWFAFSDGQESRIALTQREDVTGRNQSGKNFAVSMRETASKRSLTVPPEVIGNQLKNQDLPKSVTHFDDCQLPVDILLLTVEDCEFLSCLSYLNPGFFKTFHDDLGYVYLGDMGEDERKLSIAVMNCYRGSASPGGSMIVVLNAVNVLRPKAVFCVGSCRSLDYDKVKLGDIVMLEKLITYGPCRITEGGIEERGFKVPLKSGLLKVKLRAGDGWKPPLKDPKALEVKIYHGTILSGPVEVIDSPKHCKELIERFPEAVAMEEEGEGVFAAAHGLDIEWIVIKGISDYAGGSKSMETSWRPFASLMAASVTAHILSDAIIFEDWPHFKSTSVEKSRTKRDAQIPRGRWFDETNIKIVVAGLVGLIAVLLFFCFGSN